MKFTRLALPDVILLEPEVFSDNRGFFFESFNQKAFDGAVGRNVNFVQDNHSLSTKHVLRGFHYQIKKVQGKLVRVIRGEVLDVAIDMRKLSVTFGGWVGEILSSDNKKQLWIPEGFAHGFLVLSDCAEFMYKTTDYWAPEYERTVLWNDEIINVKWPLDIDPSLSEKDRTAQRFQYAENFSNDEFIFEKRIEL